MSNFRHNAMTPVAKLSELKDRCPKAAILRGIELVVIALDGDVRVFQGQCPHQGTPLAGVSLRGNTLTCPSHGWCFNARSGERIDYPGQPLQCFTSHVVGDDVQVDACEVGQWAAATVKYSPHAPSGRADVRSIADLPGPKGLPLLGNWLSISAGQLHKMLRRWVEEYGSTYRLQLPTTGPTVAFADPRTVRAILKDRPETFRRVRTLEPMFKEVGAHGVFSAEGESWRYQRRLVAPAFNMAELRHCQETLAKLLRRLKGRWDRLSRHGEVVNIQREMTRFTLDVTTCLALGHDLNTIEDQGGAIRDYLELIFPRMSERLFTSIPYWRYVRLPKDRKFETAIGYIRQLINDLVSQARANTAGKHPTEAANFLESLVLAKDEDGLNLSEAEVFGNVFTMLLAGEDTTAHTLTWILHYLSEYPAIQSRVQQEADAVLGRSDIPSIADCARLPYTQAVALEVMRLRPVAAMLFLEANRDVEVENIAIPKGTTLVAITSQAGYESKYFKDPDTFDPERWLNGGPAPHAPETVLPFGFGPRHCPGRNLALLEIKSVVSMISRHFSVEKPENHPPVDDQFGFVVHATPISVRFRARFT